MPLRIETLPLGIMETNCYVLCTGAPTGRPAEAECWVVDPGLGPGPLVRLLHAERLAPTRIILTHGHGDHIAGLAALKEAHPSAKLCCPARDAGMLADPQENLSAPFGFALTAPPADELLQPGQTLEMSGIAWVALDTSGHTPGGMSYYCAAEAVVLTGDALFAGSIGRCDIPGADGARLIDNIRRNLLSLPDETRVLPGHGPATTIGAERRSNPFLSS